MLTVRPVNDAMIIVRDIAGDVSQKAASRVRPSEEQLAQVDEPAEENTWHEAPDFSKHKEQLRSKFKKNKETVRLCAGDTPCHDLSSNLLTSFPGGGASYRGGGFRGEPGYRRSGPLFHRPG